MKSLHSYKEKVAKVKAMQLATMSDRGPWICTVYFVFHDDKFYWLSEPHRRHTKEIKNDPRVAITVVLKDDIPVVGIQIEGQASIVEHSATVKTVLDLYIAKYGIGKGFHERFNKGTNKHQLFCFVPKAIQVFDEANDAA